MRICIYSETALPMIGGQELAVDALAREFLAAGHQVVVLAPNPRSRYRTADKLFPYPVVRHPRFISTRRLIDPYAYWLKRVHQTYGFDVLQCHSTVPTGYLGTRTARRLGFPVVITSHGGDVTSANNKLALDAVRRRHVEAISAADALVAISSFTADGYKRLAPASRPAVEIPNGVHLHDLSQPVARPDDLDSGIQPGRYMLFLGRLSHRKGVDLVIDAIGTMPVNERPMLVIGGDGEERAALERQAATLGLVDRVRFAGLVENDKKIFLLQNSLVNLVPSRGWEAFPLVVLESFAAARPLIATRIPGLASLVRDRETGWLVEPESPQALAAAIREAITDAALCEQLGRQARADAARFDWKIVARSYLDLFAKVIAAKRPGRAT